MVGSIEAGKSEQEVRDRVTLHLQVHIEEGQYAAAQLPLTDVMQGGSQPGNGTDYSHQIAVSTVM